MAYLACAFPNPKPFLHTVNIISVSAVTTGNNYSGSLIRIIK